MTKGLAGTLLLSSVIFYYKNAFVALWSNEITHFLITGTVTHQW